MRIHQIRNATVVVEAAGQRILVDPMLGAPGTLPPYAVIRFRARMNPLTGLPENAAKTLEGVTAGIISHTHFGMDCDHLDRAGAKLLADTKVPVFCNRPDENNLRRRGLQAVPLTLVSGRPFAGGTITAFDAAHGHCVMRKLMGPGAGYFLEFPGEPSLYISGDTILTDAVRRVLAEKKPDICIIPAGSAQLDFGKPILMPLPEILEFVRLAHGTVVANHLETLNHCPTTRRTLSAAVTAAGLQAKLRIPADGETLTF